jgi:hypothetical protein
MWLAYVWAEAELCIPEGSLIFTMHGQPVANTAKSAQALSLETRKL